MAKKSKEAVIAELDARGISFNMDSPVEELRKILEEAESKDEKKAEEAELEKKNKLQFKTVPNGVGTANDHERRLTILEHKVSMLEGE